ncbi:hypothetical protein, partial [Aeromonas caviae]|uniref:hypothetical protein n=1 Tax=Aeromonas caviae TaxID=648 RepID=UPI002B489A7E
GNINMMHGDSRVMVVVCLATTSLPAPCLSTSTFPGSREEPFFWPFPSGALLHFQSFFVVVVCVFGRRDLAGVW